MKVICAGDRNYADYERVKTVLDRLHALLTITEIVSGGATGADALGEKWAEENGIDVRKFPAEWNLYGRAAGPLRNKEMAEYADFLVAFLKPGSKGTASMIEQAEMAGLSGVVFMITEQTTWTLGQAMDWLDPIGHG